MIWTSASWILIPSSSLSWPCLPCERCGKWHNGVLRFYKPCKPFFYWGCSKNILLGYTKWINLVVFTCYCPPEPPFLDRFPRESIGFPHLSLWKTPRPSTWLSTCRLEGGSIIRTGQCAAAQVWCLPMGLSYKILQTWRLTGALCYINGGYHGI